MAKWFPDKRGLAVGLAVGGYGAGSAIFGPLAQLKLIPAYGLPATFQILGAIFLVMTMVGAVLLRNPPAGYRPAGWSPARGQARRDGARIHARRDAAHAHVLPDVGGLCAGLLGGADGDQPTGAVRQERGDCGRGAFDHDAGGGRVRKRLGTDPVGVDVGPAGAHQRAADDDRDLHGRDAGAVRRREQRGAAVRGGVRRLLVLRNAAFGERRGGVGLLGHQERGRQLRDAVYRVGRGGDHRAAHRRGAVRPVSQLPGGVLHGGRAGAVALLCEMLARRPTAPQPTR